MQGKLASPVAVTMFPNLLGPWRFCNRVGQHPIVTNRWSAPSQRRQENVMGGLLFRETTSIQAMSNDAIFGRLPPNFTASIE